MLGGSPQFYRDCAYVRQHGIPEWDQVLDDGKGRLVIGASTQRQMVKHMPSEDQRDIIELAKQDKKKALATWQVWKQSNGIE